MSMGLTQKGSVETFGQSARSAAMIVKTLKTPASQSIPKKPVGCATIATGQEDWVVDLDFIEIDVFIKSPSLPPRHWCILNWANGFGSEALCQRP